MKVKFYNRKTSFILQILEGQQKRIEDELKLYVSSDPTERKKSLRYLSQLCYLRNVLCP